MATVSNFSPADGGQVKPATAIQFDVTGSTDRTYVWVEYPDGERELVWDAVGGAFTARFGNSTRSSISGGHQYQVKRTGGWQKAPTIFTDPIPPGGGGTENFLHDTTHNPVGLWQFNGDLTDSSGTGADLSVVGGSKRWTTGIKQGLRSAYFATTDGDQYRSSDPVDASLQIAGNLTAEFLVYPTDIEAGEQGEGVRFLRCHNGSDDLYNIAFENGQNHPRFFWDNGSGSEQRMDVTDYIITPGRWYHMAFTRNVGDGNPGNTSAKVYVDGREIASASGFDPPGSFSGARIEVGIRFCGFSDCRGGLNGAMQSLKVIASELTANEVLAEAERTLPPEYAAAA